MRRFAASVLPKQGARSLYVHEYHGKNLMAEFGIDHQRGSAVSNVADVIKAADKVSTPWYIVKAQVLAGGRGKGVFNTGFKGGVKLAKTKSDAQEYASKMLGNYLKTPQTGPEGAKVNQVYIAECLDIQKEYYFALLLHRQSNGPVMVASHRGGVDIEEIAEKYPEDVIREPINFNTGLTQAQAEAFAKKLGFKDGYVAKAADSMVKLYKLMIQSDATQVEINPFAETPDGRVVCIDAKINFDDNAAFRQKRIWSWRDVEQEDPKEVEAEKHGLNYIALDGNIACLVNGAGLAMATMDIVQLYGGKPANFLDVGGGATKEAVTAAFRIIQSDKNVQGILVNVFGGIMKCDVIASGIVAAARDVTLSVPLVVRLAGTNYDIGAKILADSGLPLQSASDLDDAAKKIVALTKRS